MMIRVNSSAIASLMRTGMLDSPNPGNSITIAPMRAKASMKAAASTGSSEISMRTSAHLPKFVLHRSVHFHELRKVMGTGKLIILVPLSIRSPRDELAAHDAGTSDRRHQYAR